MATSRRCLKDSSANLMILQRLGLQSAARLVLLQTWTSADLATSLWPGGNSSLRGTKRRVSSPFSPTSLNLRPCLQLKGQCAYLMNAYESITVGSINFIRLFLSRAVKHYIMFKIYRKIYYYKFENRLCRRLTRGIK